VPFTAIPGVPSVEEIASAMLSAIIACATLALGVVEADIDNVTLEMSLKPFKSMDDAYIEATCRELFQQWWPLTRHAKQVSVLLWTADGSEILTYRGVAEDELEWGRYIGGANTNPPPDADPAKLSLHQRHILYMDNPPTITYGRLAGIVAALKRVGTAINERPVRVGATFDPGPEFAQSPFKYEKHREICMGNTMGQGTFVCCYATLNADTNVYAGFPDGIPQDMTFGTFFGRQCQHFLGDLGFDYIWFSNGFGFGVEAWGATGAVFDGERFDTGRIAEVRDKITGFWKDFRAECPEFPIETRGTNLSTAMDLAADGASLADIYRGGFNMFPPPNSPWAALDGDFGLELVGYMSHIAEVPGDGYPFRYYVHDPWWLNSPWLDRYGREPHDIYLPMAVARIDGAGEVRPASSILFLTIDNSFGEMPVECPNEVIPHILRGRADAADAPGPVVWAYPFDEYHTMTFGDPPRVEEVFFGDWFMRQALTTGFPLNTVISTTNLISVLGAQPHRFDQSVILSVVPDAGSALEAALLDHAGRGGKVMLYGPLDHAGQALLDLLGITIGEPIEGDLSLVLAANPDTLEEGGYPMKIRHRPLTCAGGLRAQTADTLPDGLDVIATATDGVSTRALAVARHRIGDSGGIAWIRGANSNYYRKGGRLLATDSPNDWFPAEHLMRYALGGFGYTFGFVKRSAAQRNPMLCIARHDNAFFLSGYSPDTTVGQRFRFPQGAPVLIGVDTWLDDGATTYTMPRAWHRECRVFVDGQAAGRLSCIEQHSGQEGISRRFRVTGFDGATVRVYAPDTANVRLYINSGYPYQQGEVPAEKGAAQFGNHYILHDVKGTLTVAW